MIQQKQQKNTRTQNGRCKDKSKIGFLHKISNLPPIQTRSSSRSKLHQSLDQSTTHKKHKLSDIFYEETQPKRQEKSYVNSIITEKDSILQNSSRYQEDKQSTVMKTHQKRKNNQQQNQLQLCQFHQNKLKNQQTNKQQKPITSSRVRTHKCCETEPSQDQFNKKSRLNLLLNRKGQSVQKINLPILKTPDKFKPIKFNTYQKPQIFDYNTSKNISAQKISNFRGFLSPIEAKIITQKLSQPKCNSNCGKRNCQCFNENELKKKSPLFKRTNNHFSSDKEIAIKKIDININKLKKIENQENSQQQDLQNFNNLRKKINEKKTWRKNIHLKKIKRFDTEVLENNKFFYQSNVNDKNTEQKDLSQSKMSSGSDKFIKVASSPGKKNLMKSNFSENQIRIKQDINEKQKGKKYETINDETQKFDEEHKIYSLEQSKVKQQISDDSRMTESKQNDFRQNTYDDEGIPSGIKNSKKKNEIQKNESYFKSKKSLSSNKDLKVPMIGYTFANSGQAKISQAPNKIQNKTDKQKKIKNKKTKQQKVEALKLQIQYWIRYDIQKKIFVDNLETKKNQISSKKQGPKINLYSAVVKQTIEVQNQTSSKPIKQTQSTMTEQGSQVTVNKIAEPNPDQLVPVTFELNSPQKSRIDLQSKVLEKSRNCPSSRSNKNPINMFNRSPKSIASTRSKNNFKVPKVQECVQFVKNYKPINPQIIIQDLLQKQTFKVMPSNAKVYFGQIIKENIKHGLGVEISGKQIFEGRFENGNRKVGFLKQHDGVYEGNFENNLRHGYGIFRWNDGQVFKGQWRMGTKNGFGVWTGTDGSYYEGDWHLSMQHGKGKFVHFTSTYEGQFKNFYKQGFGKQTFPNGDKFTGEYKNGKPNGKGKYEWNDGTYYEGNFYEGLREGFGKWHQNSNSFYEGEFKQDNKHGKGIEYYKDGSFLQGQFYKGKLVQGVLYNSTRQIIKQYAKQQVQLNQEQ